jgi:two-component system, NarL family, nitrate/nitrite response regulator NarL
MSLDTRPERQLLPIDQGSPQQVPTTLICKNSLVRAGIHHILNGTRFIVTEELESSSKLPAFPDASPALNIIVENHPVDAPVELVADLKAQCPSARVVVLADHLDPTTVLQALHAGIDGLCSTRTSRDALINVLELVMLGETFIPAALALKVLNHLPRPYESGQNMTPALTSVNGAAPIAHNLSSREVEILRHLMEGDSNKVIASRLHIAEATIKVHVKTILRKLRANNRTQAAMWASAHLSTAPDSGHMTPGRHG